MSGLSFPPDGLSGILGVPLGIPSENVCTTAPLSAPLGDRSIDRGVAIVPANSSSKDELSLTLPIVDLGCLKPLPGRGPVIGYADVAGAGIAYFDALISVAQKLKVESRIVAAKYAAAGFPDAFPVAERIRELRFSTHEYVTRTLLIPSRRYEMIPRTLYLELENALLAMKRGAQLSRKQLQILQANEQLLRALEANSKNVLLVSRVLNATLTMIALVPLGTKAVDFIQTPGRDTAADFLKEGAKWLGGEAVGAGASALAVCLMSNPAGWTVVGVGFLATTAFTVGVWLMDEQVDLAAKGFVSLVADTLVQPPR
jgi:hypothetical protein